MKPPSILPLLCACLLLTGFALCLFLLPGAAPGAVTVPTFVQFLSLGDADPDTAAGHAALRALPWTALIVLLILSLLWYFARRNRK